MFKKKINLELSSDEQVIYPAIEGNDKLDKNDKFAVIIGKVSNIDRLRSVSIKDGHVQTDEVQLFKASVKEIVNAPTVNGERELNIDDIVDAPELYVVFQEIYIAITKLNAPKMDKKK